MRSSRRWQGNWEGRESTEWRGTIKNLRGKIPTFTQEAFCIGKGINKYKDVIVREPIGVDGSDFDLDLGYPEAVTRERIPVAAVSNNYSGRLFRGRKQGYKLVDHHDFLDEVLKGLASFNAPSNTIDVESLQATLMLSIYGARMHIEFLVPYYKKDAYTLKVTCRNSVDGKFALIINLFLHRTGDSRDIPFGGFHHPHTQDLKEGKVRNFFYNALQRFVSGRWINAEVDRHIIDEFIDRNRNFTAKERERVQDLLDEGIQDRVNLLRFRELLAMLFDEGRGIFEGKGQVKLVKLVTELNKLADETEAQQP